MHLEGLVRLIQAFTPAELQDAAVLYLAMRGYSSPELSDGWRDGGTDVRLVRHGAAQSRLAVQVSVERDWRRKLGADLRKAIEGFEIDSFLFISSRRLPELEFQREQDRLRDETGINVERVDSQSLASAFFEDGRVGDLLAIVGLSESSIRAAESSYVEQTVFSYLFLSDDVRSLRETVLESLVLSFVSDERSAPHRRSGRDLARALGADIGATDQQSRLLESTTDRLLQDGRLILLDGKVLPSTTEQDRSASVRALIDRELAILRNSVGEILRRSISSVSDELSSEIVSYMGATATVLAEAARGAYSRKDPNVMRRHMHERLRQLDARLHELGVDAESDRSQLRQELITAASGSPAGRALAAGEVFSFLTGLASEGLSSALGGRAGKPHLEGLSGGSRES